MAQQQDRCPIVVAGDVSIDWLAWPLPADLDVTPGVANWRQVEGTRMVARRGGSLLLADLLAKATGRRVVGQTVDHIERKTPDQHLHSLVDLVPNPKTDGADQTFRVSRLRGFCGPDGCELIQPALSAAATRAGVLVLDDSGNGFRDARAAWEGLLARARPHWLIVKMARPLAAGAMWEAVQSGPIGAGGAHDPKRLIVVISAEDLRAEGIALGRHLSWERAAEDFVRELGGNGRLETLASCANLIVRFDCDGTIHHKGLGADPPTLYFDPAHAEGGFVGAQPARMVGMTAAFTAALAASLADKPDEGLAGAIRRGVTASRRLASMGYVEVERTGRSPAPDYPLEKAMAGDADPAIVDLPIPAEAIAKGESWSILKDTMGDPAFAARRIVIEGPGALARAPLARFGNLITADRREIESLRAVGNILAEFLATPQAKPVSIAVFGPPGSGKTFAVREVAAQAAQGRTLDVLEFNLSQFTSLRDLTDAFHLVADRALGGLPPLVFFDEFDCVFEDPLGWLRYFLAPMQDGRFREGGQSHPLGAPILVFAGGTKRNFAEFVEPMEFDVRDPRRQAFAEVKGPDFASRLRGHLDIMGPDPVDSHDLMYPVRRALVLRAKLPGREPKLKAGDHLNLDEGVLNAFLTVPAYRHGVRSIEAILAMSTITGCTRFDRAYLPPSEQLELHTDAKDFMDRVKGERLDEKLRDPIAKLLHEAYLAQRRHLADDDDNERNSLSEDPAMQAWRDLPELLRDSNRLQADNIPRALRSINCFMGPKGERRTPVEAFSDDEVEILAMAEHERFIAERLRDRWRRGPRDHDLRTSEDLVPWDHLSERARSLDRSAARAIPEALTSQGWCVYRVE